MSARHYIGIDPGPTPGIVRLEVKAGVLTSHDVVQCTAGLLLPVVNLLSLPGPAFLAVERFVTRGRANAAQALTRDQVGQLQAVHPAITQRNASQVKTWATDARLDAAGLLEPCKGMRHARDAARHALFAAVHGGGIPDPLSKDWNR